MMKLSVLSAAIMLLLPAAVSAASPAEWRSQSIYFLLTDRFALTDGSTDAPCDTSSRVYCGGTWQGIINQLDYIQGMGFTAIWITPVTEQIEEDTGYGTAYHGYWQKNLYGINQNHGTADDLRSLADALHDRGMYLMIDVVANHMGYAGPGSSVDYSIYNPFNSDSYFHTYCAIDNYDDQEQVENCWLGDDVVSLPDLNTESDDVRTMYNDWIEQLVANYSADGLRIDTAKHVEKEFWPGFSDASGVYTMGEVFDGDPNYLCPYQEVLDGLLNYLTYYPARRAFTSPDGSISELADMIDTVKGTCADASLLGSFTENHDNERFPSTVDDVSQAQNLIAFTILQGGIPVIYYGQEQHYSGGADPANREALWTSGYDTTSTLYQLIANSNNLRNHAISNDDGYTTYQTVVAYQDSNNLALRKGTGGSQVVTVLTNQGSSGSSDTLSVSGAEYDAGTELMEVYTCASVTVDDSGNIPVPMESGAPRLLYPAELLAGSGLCEG